MFSNSNKKETIKYSKNDDENRRKNEKKISGLSVFMISWLAAFVGCYAIAIDSAIYFPSGFGRFVS